MEENILFFNIVVFVVLVECCNEILSITQGLDATYWTQVPSEGLHPQNAYFLKRPLGGECANIYQNRWS